MEFPLYCLVWNTTCRCNLKCKHCYNYFDSRSAIKSELSTNEAKKMISEAIKLGTKSILFTGGEPLLRKDLFELINYAKEKDLLVFLATNGTLIDDNFIKKAQGKIDKINISLDAGSSKKHDEIRGMAGSFDKSLRAIELLKNIFAVSISFTVHFQNLLEIVPIAAIAKKYKILLTIKRFIPVGHGSEDCNLELSSEKYKEVIKKVNKLKKYQKISFEDPFPSIFKRKIENSYGGCLAGIYFLAIDFNGNVYPCTKLKWSIGNIKEKSLSEIWYENEILIKLRNRELSGKCGKCKKKWVCGGCRAAAYAKNKDLLSEDPLCYH